MSFLAIVCISIVRAEQDEKNKDAVPKDLDVEYIDHRVYVYEEQYSFGQNPFLRNLENQPFVDVPGEVGKVTVGGVTLVVGIPFVVIGQIFYFPFSGQKKFYPGMKQMYFSYYDFTMDEFRYSGYYLLALPFYGVKLLVWDGPIYLYESAFGAEIENPKTFPTVEE
jgi:hypothetical protein